MELPLYKFHENLPSGSKDISEEHIDRNTHTDW
jgi:hypothetical protein